MQYDSDNERSYGKRDVDLWEDGHYITGPNAKYNYGIEVVSDTVIRKHALASTKEMYNVVSNLVTHFIRHPSHLVVPVYAFHAEKITVSKQDAHRYYYDMMRMATLSKDEKNFVYYYKGAYSSRQEEEKALRQNNTKLANFLAKVISEGRYHDLHDMNVMKDEDDNYRLIDIEGFYNGPLDRPGNEWITRDAG